MNQVKVHKSKCRPREGTGIRARIKRRNMIIGSKRHMNQLKKEDLEYQEKELQEEENGIG
jgi:cation transport ATPase